MRMRPKRPPPWTPEELGVEVFDENVPEPVLRGLASVYGPLQHRTLDGASQIVDPALSP